MVGCIGMCLQWLQSNYNCFKVLSGALGLFIGLALKTIKICPSHFIRGKIWHLFLNVKIVPSSSKVVLIVNSHELCL